MQTPQPSLATDVLHVTIRVTVVMLAVIAAFGFIVAADWALSQVIGQTLAQVLLTVLAVYAAAITAGTYIARERRRQDAALARIYAGTDTRPGIAEPSKR